MPSRNLFHALSPVFYPLVTITLMVSDVDFPFLIFAHNSMANMGDRRIGTELRGDNKDREKKLNEGEGELDHLLQKRLETVLPSNLWMGVHHISTPPRRCDPLYSSLPGQDEEETWCEKHFLLVSIPATISPTGDIPVYGLEVLIYKTRNLTTIFVSKADSTGLMLCVPWTNPALSPMKTFTTTFLRLLADTQQRDDRRTVISLFARSQPTYLFPGSGENELKRILDDRGLIKWWAQVMDIILDLDAPMIEDKVSSNRPEEATPVNVQVFCRIPGYSARETKPFVPKNTKESSPFRTASLAEDPFQLLATRPDLPARCVVPHFYDDPKTRFAEELDGYDKVSDNGNWSSVPSLTAFWDLMQHRQECAAGKLVGFLWGVFTPKGLVDKEEYTSDSALPTSHQNSESTPTQPASSEEPAFYESPGYATSEVVLTHEAYETAQEVLASGDFSKESAAIQSMLDWMSKVEQLTDVRFGYLCPGKAVKPRKRDHEEPKPEHDDARSDIPQTETTAPGKKRTVGEITDEHKDPKGVDPVSKPSDSIREAKEPSPVNLLSGGMIRKKPKLGYTTEISTMN